MKVLVMMSGGVDSSVAAAMVRDAGHETVGVTLKLWGGDSDSGCCSVSDVDDARRVADRLGLDHHVFNLGDEFTRNVVGPYADAHAAGRTPNPCIECNRHLKFAAVDQRARALGFDAVATGHHARIVTGPGGAPRLARGIDAAKDQSYVLHMLDGDRLARTLLPIGDLTKAEVRERAAALGLRTAAKPDSQDVCFITRRDGRAAFLGQRIDFTPGRVVDGAGATVGRVDAIELVTLGQRKGLGLAGGQAPRYVVDVDRPSATVTVGDRTDLRVDRQVVGAMTWVDDVAVAQATARDAPVTVQISAHGRPQPATVTADADPGRILVTWAEPQVRVAPGQSVVVYAADQVLGGGLARPA